MSDCIGPTNIIPNNNEIVLQDVNRTITVIDNNCCTTITVTQPITETIQVNVLGPQGPAGSAGAPGPQGPPGTSVPFSNIGNDTYATTSSIEITGSLDITGSLTVNTINVGQNTINFIDENETVITSLFVSGSDLVLSTGSIIVSGGLFLGTASYALNVTNIDTASLVNTGSFNDLTSSFNNFTSSYNTSSFTGSLTGELIGTSSWAYNAVTADNAASVTLIAGPGIDINGLEITASVRTINAISPDSNGNIAINLTAVLTGDSASLVAQDTSSIAEATVWVISGDSTPANNGDTYIFRSSSVGEWLPIAPLDTAAADARYLKLTPQSPLAGDLNLGNNDIINGRLITATGFTSSLFGTASWANNSIQAISASFLPVGTYNITSSWAQTSSRALTSSFLPVGTYQITSSWAISASRALTSSLALSASSVFVNGAAGGAQVPLLTRGAVGTLGILGNISVFEVSGVAINTTTKLLSGVTASWAQSASQALTASRALLYTETDPIFLSKEGSLITTSSFNTFTSSIQNQVTSLTNATSSYVQNSQTSSFVTNNQTSSFVINSQTGSFATTSSFNNFTSSYNTGSFTGSFTGSLLGIATSASYITGSTFTSTNPVLSASYALTASYALNGGGGNIDTSALVNTASFNAYTESINTFTQSYYVDSSSFVDSISSLDGTTTALVQGFFDQSSQISSLETFSSSIKNFTSSINTFTQSYYADSASFASQINNINVDTSFLVTTASFNSFTSSINTFTSSYNTGSFTGSLTGVLNGTASWAQNAVVAQTANSVNLIQGPGITVNGLAITASVRTVNNISPDSNGNIPVSLVAVLTGDSASLTTYPTSGLADGTVWIVSGDSTPNNNGDAYILDSGSVGVWLPIAPLDQAAGDARYLMLNPQSSLTGNLNLGTNNITNGGSITATSFTGSLRGTSSWASNFNETDPIFLSKEGSLITTSSFNNLTSSFNNFTSSYQTDSSSFNIRINSLTNATSSYVQNSQTSSFVRNSQTGSFTTTASFNSFTSSYQTDSSSFNSRIDSINNSTGGFAVTSSTNYFKATQYITSSQGSILLNPDGRISLFEPNGITAKIILNTDSATERAIQINSGSEQSTFGYSPFTYGTGLFFISNNNLTIDGRIIRLPVNSDGADVKVTFYTPISASLGITSSLFGTSTSASYITGSTFISTNPALSSSYALTASYALNGGGGGPTSPGGSNTQIQYNNNTTFGGVPTLTYDGTTLRATGSFTGSFTGPVLVTTDTTNTLRSLVFTTAGASENKSLFIDGDATNDLAYNPNTETLQIGGTNNSTGIISSSIFYSKYSAAFPLIGFIGTASWAQSSSISVNSSLATSASYITGSVFTSTNLALSSSYALSSSAAGIASKVIISPTSTNSDYRVLFTSNYTTGDTNVDNVGGDFIYNPSTNVLTVARAVSSSTFFSTTSPGIGFIGTSSWAESASISISASRASTSSLAITSSTTQIAAGTFGTYNLLPYTNTSTAQDGSYPLSFSTRLAFNSNSGSLRLTSNPTSTIPTLVISGSASNRAVSINGSLIVSGSNGAGVFSKGGTIADLINGVSTTGSYAVWRAPFPCQVVAVYGRRSGGTACQINASKNNTLHSATNLSLSTDNTWTPVPTLQNTSYTIGDSLEIIISGSANNQVAVQVDFIKI